MDYEIRSIYGKLLPIPNPIVSKCLKLGEELFIDYDSSVYKLTKDELNHPVMVKGPFPNKDKNGRPTKGEYYLNYYKMSTSIGCRGISSKEFNLEKLNRPASGEETLERRVIPGKEYSPPCSSHDKESERLDTIKEKAGLKYDNGKLRYDLYPIDAYEGCTKVLTFGANKYTPDGWKTVPDAKNRYYAALVRHLNAQKNYTDAGGKGLAPDEESGLSHLDHAQCCLVFLRELSK